MVLTAHILLVFVYLFCCIYYKLLFRSYFRIAYQVNYVNNNETGIVFFSLLNALFSQSRSSSVVCSDDPDRSRILLVPPSDSRSHELRSLSERAQS